MTQESPILSLPLIQPAQAQKHVTHNEAIELLDLIVQLVLIAVDQMAPPDTPVDGASYAVPPGASGAWAGQAGQIASWRGGGWLFVAPQPGWRAFVVDRGAVHHWDGGGWRLPYDDLPQLGINASADATNRLTIRAAAALFDHDGSDHRIKVNKAGPAQTASLLFQSAYSGRAEMGLTGDDDFAIKTSPDGADWLTAIRVDGTTGRVALAEALHLTPGSVPVMAQAGDLYFDSALAKLRCYDGTIWHDLF
jgi:hypothetical protein